MGDAIRERTFPFRGQYVAGELGAAMSVRRITKR